MEISTHNSDRACTTTPTTSPHNSSLPPISSRSASVVVTAPPAPVTSQNTTTTIPPMLLSFNDKKTRTSSPNASLFKTNDDREKENRRKQHKQEQQQHQHDFRTIYRSSVRRSRRSSSTKSKSGSSNKHKNEKKKPLGADNDHNTTNNVTNNFSLSNLSSGLSLTIPTFDTTTTSPAMMMSTNTHPFEERIKNALYKSSDINPIIIEIKNLSYWFKYRKIMGAKRHMARMVTCNENGGIWFASIYDVIVTTPLSNSSSTTTTPTQQQKQRRQTRTHRSCYDIVVKDLGAFPSELKAYHACDKACATRDSGGSGPLSSNGSGSSSGSQMISPEGTHFHVLVVSEKFEGIAYSQRIEMVYHALMDEFFDISWLSSIITVRQNHGRSDSKGGKGLKGFGVVGRNVLELPHLRHISANMPFQIIFELRASSQWIPVPKEQKRQREQKHHHQRHRPPKDSSSSKQHKPHYQFMHKYKGLTHTLANAIIRLQRLFRITRPPRILHYHRKLHSAAIFLQRITRGVLYRHRVATATTAIQSSFRGLIARRTAQWRRHVLTNMATSLQHIVRGWIGRTYVQWVRDHRDSAVSIQRVVRGFIGRNCRVRREIVMKHFVCCLDERAREVQRVYRGWRGRQRKQKQLNEVVHEVVVVPAVRRIQGCWWGMVERRCFQKKLRRWNAARDIQRHWRGYVKRQWLRDVHWEIYRRLCVIKIQALFRGVIDRKILYRLRKIKHHIHVIIPNAILIQAQYRGFVHRNRMGMRKKRWQSAITIQGAYRRRMARILLKQKWMAFSAQVKESSAIHIQKHYRAWIGRRVARFKRATEASRRLVACRIIIRAWCRFRDVRRYHQLRQVWRRQQSAKLQSHLNSDWEAIHEDIKDIERDISLKEERIRWATKRGKDVTTFLDQAARRISLITYEMAHLDEKDEKQQWNDLLMDEQCKLKNQILIAENELKMCRYEIVTAKADIVKLQLEWDDVLMDLDAVCVLQVHDFELSRRREIEAAINEKDTALKKRIVFEMNRWKIKDKKVSKYTKSDAENTKMSKSKKQHKDNGEIERTSLSIESMTVHKVFKMKQEHNMQLQNNIGVESGTCANCETKTIDINKMFDAVVGRSKHALENGPFALERYFPESKDDSESITNKSDC